MIYALVENVRSLYNVGAIFRTADGAGVSKVFLTGITGRPPHREIRKVALGAEEAIEWEYYQESIAVVEKLKKENVQIVVLEATGGSICYDKADYRFPLCLAVGHEYNGVSDALLKRADLLIHIPMKGQKISLNVAVAVGVAVYEISRLQGTFQG
ncbi:MAG: TrmH family RNA methyltransferase [bacterium]